MQIFLPVSTRKGLSLSLIIFMMVSLMIIPSKNASLVNAAEATVSSMTYFSANDGPVISKSGVAQASYGFVMPIFNGGTSTWEDVHNDVGVKVKVSGSWVDIDSLSSFVYNQNWGHWNDSGIYGFWFVVSSTTEIQLYSKTNQVTLDYTLVFQQVNTTTITSMTPTQGPQITAGFTGGAGFTYPIFNNNAALIYEAVADDLKVYVKPINSNTWIDIDNNAASGWIYDSNFGQFTEGGGGYWFTVTESINVKLESKTSSANLIYTIIFNTPTRNLYTLTPYDGTTYSADISGAIGIPLPKIDGGAPIGTELGQFVYEINKNGQWVALSNSSQSGFTYAANGYNNMSDANQWGYWADYIYGLWFQPIQEDMQIRIGYPLNGQQGGNIGANYVYYTFIGNPNAPRPDVSDQEDIVIGTPTNAAITGMNLIWQDEFNGTSLDLNKWNYEEGYYINNDPNTWGWGNAELQHYTSSSQNVFVQDGNLNIRALHDSKNFPQDPNRYAQYSSGKINTKDHLSLQYGRIDIRAKLPTGNGVWPALWMLPEDSVYGAWAASGEIDIMEAKGRLPGTTSGAIHYGGQWPVNRYLAGEYHFPEGQTFANDYHVYSIIWEEDNMKWYVDGKFFFKVTREQWYSVAAPNNPDAPFDQPFYLIINLAIGGHFDGGLTPSPSDIPATMQVDYVRVYKEGTGGQPTPTPTTTPSPTPTATPSPTPTPTPSPTAPTTYIIGDAVRGIKQTGNNLLFYVNGATFADLHYKLNNGAQQNVSMTGNGNYTYPVNNLQHGDIVDYFFTYNPGQGAIDTTWQTYIHGVTQGVPESPTSPVSVTSISLNQTTGQLNAGQTLQLLASITPANATNQQISWSSSNPSIATVNQNGLVTAITQGSVTITATTLDGNKVATSNITVTSTPTVIIGDATRGIKKTGNDLLFYVNGATFADLHYKINNGAQQNVAMSGNGNYTYAINNMQQGDTIEYFFTYNPGQGAIDTTWQTYIHGVTQGVPE